jgi:hypothetical protein
LLPFKSYEVQGHKVFINFYDSLNDSDERKKKLKEIISNLKIDINKGRFIRMDKAYPDKYRKLGVTNLYVENIGSDRLIYTIRTTNKNKIYQLLEYMSHSEYDLLFHNKKTT